MSDIGKLRRSTLVSTFGPGAIVDFRDGDATISAIVTGLEEWDRNFPPAGVTHPQSTVEPRLLRKLRQRGHDIAGFRLPPVLSDSELEHSRCRLIAAEFPRWHQCPRCDRLGPAREWGQRAAGGARFCPECTGSGREVHVVPVRFVMACDQGHVEDFPWHFRVGHMQGCSKPTFLRLRSVGAGLSGLRLSCPACGAERNMEGIFAEETWRGFSCHGRRPWLAGPDQAGCDRPVRAVQRGATNLYYPVTESSLDIPPWSDPLQRQLGQFWSPIMDVEDQAERKIFIRALARNLGPTLEALRMSVDQLIAEVERRRALLERNGEEDLRDEEYRQFTDGHDTPRDEGGEFEIRVEPVPPEISTWISRAVRAVRLREVRVLTGFTRILPPGEGNGVAVAALASGSPGWLPAIEVFGEGVFLRFDHARLAAWEALDAVRKRSAEVERRWVAEHVQRYGAEPAWRPSARFLLVHTFSHALMRQLTLDSGYSTTSLRERLYVGAGAPGMAGLLIYTAATDADGTLGGLQRQGGPDRLRRTVPAAIQAVEWCSSDPLCITGIMAAPESASGAACHACVLSPETSCEHFNRLLDRALLVGSPEQPELGFFRDLLIRG